MPHGDRWVLVAPVLFVAVLGSALVGARPLNPVDGDCALNLMTASPVALASTAFTFPMGNISEGHVFPTQHMYFYFPRVSAEPEAAFQPTAVVSPGRIRILGAARTPDPQGNTGLFLDAYRVLFQVCDGVTMYFDHLTALDPRIRRRIGDFDRSPTVISTSSILEANIELRAGAPIGTVAGTHALDLGAIDENGASHYVDDTRYLPDYDALRAARGLDPVVFTNDVLRILVPHRPNECPLDYFTAAIRDAILPRMSGYGGQAMRAPGCGRSVQDDPQTLIGSWFATEADHVIFNEDDGVSLVEDPIFNDPAASDYRHVFKFGGSQPGIDEHDAFYFKPLPVNAADYPPGADGSVNRNFSTVSEDPSGPLIQCYENLEAQPGSSVVSNTILYVRIAGEGKDATVDIERILTHPEALGRCPRQECRAFSGEPVSPECVPCTDCDRGNGLGNGGFGKKRYYR